MSLRAAYLAGLALVLVVNSWDAVTRVEAFAHRYRGESALEAAALSTAYDELIAASLWQPGDAPGYILIARAVQTSEANGVEIAALERTTPEERLGLGVMSLSKAIALNPADAWAWFNLADLYRGYRSGRGRIERMHAVVAAAKAGTPSPESVAPIQARRIEPEDKLLVAAGRMAVRLEPNFYFYHDLLSLLYWETGEHADAEREIRASFALTPSPEAHSVLTNPGFASEMAESILKGIDESEQSASADPVLRARSRAELLRSLGRDSDAIDAYKQLREMGDRETAAASDLAIGQILQEEGEDTESLVMLGRAVEADPEGDYGTLALYYLGVAHGRLADHAKAVGYIRRYLSRRPGSVEVVLELGNELEALGQGQEAERTYLSALRGFPNEPEVYVRLIKHLLRQRRVKEAQGYAERLKAVAPDDGRSDELLQEVAGAQKDAGR